MRTRLKTIHYESIYIVILLYIMVGLISCSNKPENILSDEQELKRLENAWADAVVNRDTLFLSSIWADNYSWTSSFGKVWTRSETLTGIISGTDVVQNIESDDVNIRIYKNTGVVTGHTKFTEILKDKDISGEERFTDTWVKINCKWKCVAMHCSRVASE